MVELQYLQNVIFYRTFFEASSLDQVELCRDGPNRQLFPMCAFDPATEKIQNVAFCSYRTASDDLDDLATNFYRDNVRHPFS